MVPENPNQIPDPNLDFDLVTYDLMGNRTSRIESGQLMGLLDLRDNEIPKILKQLDEFVINFSTEFNRIHNKGSGYPPTE